MNPLHSVPTLVESDGRVLLESRAIIAYLVDQYAPDCHLYPKEPAARSRVDELLYFDIGRLYSAQSQLLVG